MDTPELQTFGARLKWARKQAKFTQDQACTAIGIGQGTLSELENNKYDSSTFTPQLADLYSVSSLWLATGKGSPKITRLIQRDIDPADDLIKNSPAPIKEWSEIINIKTGQLAMQQEFRYFFEGDIMTGPSGAQIPTRSELTVNPATPVNIGNVALASIDGYPAIGALAQIGAKLFLRPSNPQYPAIEVQKDQIIGPVVGFYTKMN